jgi:hypothetical protein
MTTFQTHTEVRAALSAADELSRDEHSLHRDTLAEVLAALRTALRDIDLELGRAHQAQERSLDGLHDVLAKVRRHLDAARPTARERARVDALLHAVAELEDRLRGRAASIEATSSIRRRPLAGRTAAIAGAATALVAGAALVAARLVRRGR